MTCKRSEPKPGRRKRRTKKNEGQRKTKDKEKRRTKKMNDKEKLSTSFKPASEIFMSKFFENQVSSSYTSSFVIR
ncbi:hypothetical protein MSBRW_2015 [Methanosarcina barkeri str. Wiesmoor]|uniref:Uncharacterized protein n=1 Tax=Methanosarcina barkeri str. Wiesmoor TaxID=1434109 RepID=A0A0E3QMN7_METBA|nr:hypothetical protein MSBRW_2015 [Methanosarcina barkeri str. Wiesmoor]